MVNDIRARTIIARKTSRFGLALAAVNAAVLMRSKSLMHDRKRVDGEDARRVYRLISRDIGLNTCR